ncbi:MAG: DHA2 family efflux MFS transporter permease subunit, partial [Alphaproteobacteria bacterium]
TFMVTMDNGLLSISLPVIVTDLRADLSLAGWLFLVYALVTASLYLPCGRLSDLVWRKKVFVSGFLTYAISTLAAGASTSAGQLIFLRSLQATGCALVLVNSFALLTTLFPPEERGRAMGIAGGTVSALGYTLGPVAGGILTQAFGWRSIFYLTATMSLVGCFAARRFIQEDRVELAAAHRQPFDWIGSAIFALALTALILALASGQKGAWHTARVRVELVSAIFVFCLFIWWENRVRHPLLDLTLFRIRAFSLGNLARLISFVVISMSNLIVPFFLQLAMGAGPMRSGMLVAATPFCLALLSPLTGWLSEKLGPRLLSAAGLAVKGIAFFALTSLTVHATNAEVALRLGLLGIGFGFFQTPNNYALMGSLPHDRLGVGSSFLSIVRSIGNSFGAALATTIVSLHLIAVTGQTSLEHLKAMITGADSPVLEAFLKGFYYTCWCGVALCLFGALVSLVRTSDGVEHAGFDRGR